MKTCKLCHEEITGPARLICPACADALDDLVAKKTGLQAEIRGQVIEALKMALVDLEAWHREAGLWYDVDGDPIRFNNTCKCLTCQKVIPAVKAALEALNAQIL